MLGLFVAMSFYCTYSVVKSLSIHLSSDGLKYSNQTFCSKLYSYVANTDYCDRQKGNSLNIFRPGAVARSEACSLGMHAAPSSIPTSGTFFRGDLVMKTFLRPFSLFRWFKKSSCQLLAKECKLQGWLVVLRLSTDKLPRRLAQEQCG